MAGGARLNWGYNDWFPIPNKSPNNPDGYDWPLGPRGLQDPIAPLYGGQTTYVAPVDPAPQPVSPGARLTSFFNDFYNRIYIKPVRIDFGAITSEASVVVNVWNAYYNRNAVLSSVQYDAQQGITVSGPAVPHTFKPLAYYNYTVTASVNGPALLDTSILWNFNIPFVFTMPVVGIRTRLLGLEPAWPPTGRSYQVAYSFSTAIITSRGGQEQRIARRSSPRKSVSFVSHVAKDRFREFRDSMRYWQHRSFATPEISRFVTMTQQMLPGEDSVTVDSVPPWAQAEVQVIFDYLDDQDIRIIESVAGSTITFKTGVGRTWPAGTRIYYALTGNLGANVQAPRETNSVAVVSVDFQVTPLSEIPEPLPAAPLMYNGREVFLKKPNWASKADVTSVHPVEILDYGYGPTSRETPIEFGSEIRQATYLNRSVQEAEDILAMFRRMKGRQGEFYMPTWEYDFVPKILAPAGTALFRVEGTEFAKVYSGSTVQKALFVQHENGNIYLRKVSSIDTVSDSVGVDSVITVDVPWDVDISKDTIVMAGWLMVWRFQSDILTLEWLTSRVANAQLTMVSLEDLPVETP